MIWKEKGKKILAIKPPRICSRSMVEYEPMNRRMFGFAYILASTQAFSIPGRPSAIFNFNYQIIKKIIIHHSQISNSMNSIFSMIYIEIISSATNLIALKWFIATYNFLPSSTANWPFKQAKEEKNFTIDKKQWKYIETRR